MTVGTLIAVFEEKFVLREELQKEIEGGEYNISTYGEDTEEWKEANAKLEENQKELSRQIELSLGFGELGGKANNFEEDKIWKENGETRRKECGGNQVPTIREEEGNEACQRVRQPASTVISTGHSITCPTRALARSRP